MDAQPSLDQLTRELRRRGLPAAYIRRFVEELDDHITDTIEERSNAMSKDAQGPAALETRIGDPVRLAEVAAAEYRRANFCGRHPVLTCLVAPIPLVLLAWIAVFGLGIGALVSLSPGDEVAKSATAGDWSAAAVWASLVGFRVAGVIPPALVAVLLCYLARRGDLSWRWSLAACALVGVVAALFKGNLELPGGMSRGTMQLGLGFGTAHWVQPLLQCLLPLTLGLWFAWRSAHRPIGPMHDEFVPAGQSLRRAA